MTREEAIKGLTSLVEVRRKYVGMQTMKDEIECLEMAIKALEQEPEWIPVSERLPEEDGDYLVTYEKGYAEDYDLPLIGIVGFEVDCESFGYWYEYFDRQTMGSLGREWEEIKVIAWMPLPDPYKAESEEYEPQEREEQE